MPSMFAYFGPSRSSFTKVEGFSGPFGFSTAFTGLRPRSIFLPAVLFEASFSLALLFFSSAFLSVAFLSTASHDCTALLVLLLRVLLRVGLFRLLRRETRVPASWGLCSQTSSLPSSALSSLPSCRASSLVLGQASGQASSLPSSAPCSWKLSSGPSRNSS